MPGVVDSWSDGDRVWKGGAIAGLAGGFSMASLTIVASAAQGFDVWLGLKIPAAPFLGEPVFQTGFAWNAVLVGVLVHCAVAAMWGVLFAFLAFGLSPRMTLMMGGAWGFVVWLATTYVVFPLLGIGDLIRSIPLGYALVEHLLFGLTVGLMFRAFQRPGTTWRAARSSAP